MIKIDKSKISNEYYFLRHFFSINVDIISQNNLSYNFKASNEFPFSIDFIFRFLLTLKGYYVFLIRNHYEDYPNSFWMDVYSK